jgi:hypothetical protein
MDVHNSITVIVGLITIVGAIYRLSQIEANINNKFDKLEMKLLLSINALQDNLSDKLGETGRKLDIHLTEYKGDKENIYEYRLNAADKAIEHKFNRLANWITQIAQLLYSKYGFQIRDDKF